MAPKKVDEQLRKVSPWQKEYCFCKKESCSCIFRRVDPVACRDKCPSNKEKCYRSEESSSSNKEKGSHTEERCSGILYEEDCPPKQKWSRVKKFNPIIRRSLEEGPAGCEALCCNPVSNGPCILCTLFSISGILELLL